MNRSQKEVLALQKKVEESLRREEELRQQNRDMKQSQERLRVEAEGVNALSFSEKVGLQKLREEHRDLVNDLREKREELRVAAQELMNMKGIKCNYSILIVII